MAHRVYWYFGNESGLFIDGPSKRVIPDIRYIPYEDSDFRPEGKGETLERSAYRVDHIIGMPPRALFDDPGHRAQLRTYQRSILSAENLAEFEASSGRVLEWDTDPLFRQRVVGAGEPGHDRIAADLEEVIGELAKAHDGDEAEDLPIESVVIEEAPTPKPSPDYKIPPRHGRKGSK